MPIRPVGQSLLLTSGCVTETDVEDPNTDDVGSIQHTINGQITFGGECTAVMQNRLHEAMDLITAQLFNPDGLKSCMNDAYLFMHNDATPEAIVARLKENMPTHIDCFDEVCGSQDALGCAPVSPNAETLDVRKSFVLNDSISEIAGTIIHEVAHNKGWTHPNVQHFDFPFTVNEQVEACIQTTSPNGLDRSAAPGEAELAPSGGGGGLPFELACPQSAFMRGVRADSSNGVNRIGLDGDNGTQTARTGEFKDSTRSGTFDCAADEVVIGVWGTSSALVDQLGLRCAKRAAVAAGDETPETQDIWVGGGAAGIEFQRTCPTGMAIQRVYGRSGARIDQLRIVCQNLNASARGASHALSIAGTADGTTLRGQCSGFGAMTSLYGRSGGAVDRLGGFCRTTINDIDGIPVIGGTFREHLIEAVGGSGGDQGTKIGDGDFAWKDSCPGGSALIGLHLRVGATAGAGVTQVQGICASPGEWSRSGNVNRTFIGPRGGTSGAIQTRECPRGEYLVGMQVWAEKTVHATPTVQGVVPICRRLGTPLIIVTNPIEAL